MDQENVASKPGHLACLGEWRSGAKTMTLSERGENLVLEMGPGSPILYVVPTCGLGEDVWPMHWAATKNTVALGDPAPDLKLTSYILELATPTSPRLLVKRPVGEGCVEFCRPGAEPSAPSARGGRQSRSRSRSRREYRSRPGDSTKGSAKGSGKGKGDKGGKGDEVRDKMVAEIKQGQRESNEFKQRWYDYCDRYGRGFYDPARHDTRLIEEFLNMEDRPVRGRSPVRQGNVRRKSFSRSRSNAGRRVRGGSSSRGCSQSPVRRKRRPRHEKRRRRGTPRRRRRKMHRSAGECGTRKGRGRRNRSQSASPDRPPDRQAAISAAERAVAEAEEALDRIRDDAVPAEEEAVRHEEKKQKDAILRATEKAKADADEVMQSKLAEAEAKLLDEKAARLREVREKLDKAIADRLAEAEERLRREVGEKVDEARRRAQDAANDAIEAAVRHARDEHAARVEAAKDRVKSAQKRMHTYRAGEAPNGSAASDGSRDCDHSSSYSRSDSEGDPLGDASHSKAPRAASRSVDDKR